VQDLARRLDGLGLSCKGDSEALAAALRGSTEALLAASLQAEGSAEARAARLEERVRAARDAALAALRGPAEALDELKASVSVPCPIPPRIARPPPRGAGGV
jgi:hypothetical protein